MTKSKRKPTIAVIGTNGLPGRYGGWDQLLNHITSNLVDEYQFVVYTSSNNKQEGLKTYNGAILKNIPLKANGIQSIPYDILSMMHALIKRYDVLLVLGTSGCLFFPIIRLFGGRVILNPDGAEWKRGKWGKFIKRLLLLFESIGIKYSNGVIADNKVIQDYISDEYNKHSSLIAYGGDNVRTVQLSEASAQKYQIAKGSYAFKVCRIVPENNIELILQAFSETQEKLILIGNWDFSQYGKDIRDKFSVSDNLLLLDPIYEQEILDELRSNCGLYVHGHSVGGTNPSLVEAMSLGLSSVIFDVNYNRETTESKARYFASASELKTLVLEHFNGKNSLNSVGVDLLEVAKRRYTWAKITNQYSSVFKEFL